MNDIETKDITPEEIELAEPTFKIRITPDKMQAYLAVSKPENCRTVLPEDLLKALEDAGVTYGINEKEIDRCCELQSFFSEVLCAQGVSPVDGIDGTFTYHFDLNPELKPRVRSDGTADFHDMGLIQSVAKDEVLCSRTMPIPGEDGMNVFGIAIPFKPGAEKKFMNGANTYISEDLLELRSSVDGCINFKNNIVAVNDTFTVNGNVDPSTGDIVFCGNVIVMGDVREGFKVHAGKDVTIRGMVEGATIWAKGNILITEGMNGMNEGKLFAGGNIKGKYFQNAEIMCQGDITADYYLYGTVTAGGAINADGFKGLMLGGIYQAGASVTARTIGADSYLTTKVSIIESEEGFWNPESKKTPEEIEAELALMKEEEREQWLAEHVYKVPSAPQDAKVIAKAVAYPGVKLTFGQLIKNLNEEYNNVKFYLNDDGIADTPAPKF